MKEQTRITLDWLQLPFAIVWDVFGKVDRIRLKALDEMQNFRSKTIPFKVIRYIISKRVL